MKDNNLNKEERNFYYYSKKQIGQGHSANKVYAQLQDGSIVKYSEATSIDKRVSHKSMWDDSVFLGIGCFHHIIHCDEKAFEDDTEEHEEGE